MLLKDKVAVIYGAGGGIGGAVARAYAAAGAKLYLSGRTQESLDALAKELGDTVNITVLDARDEDAVNAYVDKVVAEAGQIDISFNLVGYDDVQEPLMEISLADFLQPIQNAMQAQFLTTRAAARHMRKRKSGVILTFGGGGPQTAAGLGGFKVALDAIEGLRRQWALELGEDGIRVVTIKTGGILETVSTEMENRDEIYESIVGDTLLKYEVKLEDVGNVAVFLASDQARMITGTEINISAGGMME